jgi:GTPase SAR1 family protein
MVHYFMHQKYMESPVTTLANEMKKANVVCYRTPEKLIKFHDEHMVTVSSGRKSELSVRELSQISDLSTARSYQRFSESNADRRIDEISDETKISKIKKSFQSILSRRPKKLAEHKQTVENHKTDDEHCVTLQLWDLAGDNRFAAFTKAYLRGAHVVFIVFNVCDFETFEHAQKYHEDIRVQFLDDSNVLYFMIGNQCDSPTALWQVSEEQVNEYASQFNDVVVGYTSAKHGINLSTQRDDNIFRFAAQLYLNFQYQEWLTLQKQQASEKLSTGEAELLSSSTTSFIDDDQEKNSTIRLRSLAANESRSAKKCFIFWTNFFNLNQ